VLASLLGVLNQLLASHFGTLACLSVLGMAVWLPSDIRLPRRIANTASGLLAPPTAQGAHPIIDPASAAAVVQAIGLRKWMVSGWLLLALFFVGMYLGLATTYSLVADQLAEMQAKWNGSMRAAVNQDRWLPLTSLMLTSIYTVLSVIAKTYLAQVFYTDAAAIAVVSVWHTEKADEVDVALRRAAELEEFAAGLDLSAADRVMAEKPKGEQTRARDQPPPKQTV